MRTTLNLEITYLEVKKEHAKYDWFASRLKYNKQGARIACRDWNAPSKVQLRYLEILKHQERLNDIKKGTRDNFLGCKTLIEVEPIHLEVNWKKLRLTDKFKD